MLSLPRTSSTAIFIIKYTLARCLPPPPTSYVKTSVKTDGSGWQSTDSLDFIPDSRVSRLYTQAILTPTVLSGMFGGRSVRVLTFLQSACRRDSMKQSRVVPASGQVPRYKCTLFRLITVLCPNDICLCDRIPFPYPESLKENAHRLDLLFILCGFISKIAVNNQGNGLCGDGICHLAA